MHTQSKLKAALETGAFVMTAELLPGKTVDPARVTEASDGFVSRLTAVNVADNPDGPVLSSLAGSKLLMDAGVEPIYQLICRDRNRIALQSDILGAAALGIRNILCLSGHHQALTGSRSAANVYDVDSFQLLKCVRTMRDDKKLLDGAGIDGEFPVFIGAAAGPDMTPMELNMIRLKKKIDAGADFIQTQAVFRPDVFNAWLSEARSRGLLEKVRIIAGILPLECADEARMLREKYTDLVIPETVVHRMEKAGDEAAQKKEGLAIAAETVRALKELDGVAGIHFFTGGKEAWLSDIIAASER